ncbi:Fc.00g063550.m01.CDS01 [Cosmosporella sp. VM-42]
MEPVPETERMEEFRSSPVPSLRINNPNAISALSLDVPRKPPILRRTTDPSPTSPSASSWASLTTIPYRPRTASPLSGAHSRSRSTTSLAPPMSRTQSMPGVNGSGHILYSPQMRPGSPSGSPSRVRIPRKPADEAFPPISPVRTSVLEPERRHADRRSTSPIFGVSTSTPARLRRPSSPLRSVTHSSTGSLTSFPSTPSSSISSASSYRSYDALSGGYPASFSSVPSTPTSTRSRSPSISSLETIPDSPDAEEAALEADRIAQLKAAADAADGGDSSDSKGRSSLDVQTRGRTLGFGSRDKRKRWSVCGAERRGDLDLETIWED